MPVLDQQVIGLTLNIVIENYNNRLIMNKINEVIKMKRDPGPNRMEYLSLPPWQVVFE